jgi:hypothetical protein
MSEAHTEDRLGRIEATLASLVPLIHRIDERLNTALPHLATKAELMAGLSDLRTEITELKIELADKPGKLWLTTAIGVLLVSPRSPAFAPEVSTAQEFA